MLVLLLELDKATPDTRALVSKVFATFVAYETNLDPSAFFLFEFDQLSPPFGAGIFTD